MLISTTTRSIIENDDFCAGVKTIKDAGFDAYDLSLGALTDNETCRFNKEDYKSEAENLRAYADSIGIVCNQAHAPYPSSYNDKDKTAWAYGKIVRAIEIAAVCGAKQIVVHPKKHLPYVTNREELKKINIDFYMSLLPYSEKFGIKIAVENMWGRDPYDSKKTVITDSVCSHPEEFCEYLDALPRENFVACLDIGHTVLTHENITRMITTLGHDRLKALHVHDNSLLSDDHTLPFLGKIPFVEVVSALKAIDYDGDFTLEAVKYDGKFPGELKPAALKFSNEVARYLARQISDNR